jgi:hypothetical protein
MRCPYFTGCPHFGGLLFTGFIVKGIYHHHGHCCRHNHDIDNNGSSNRKEEYCGVLYMYQLQDKQIRPTHNEKMGGKTQTHINVVQRQREHHPKITKGIICCCCFLFVDYSKQ